MHHESTDPAVAVLQSQMSTATDTLARIETKLDTFNSMFVSKAEFQEFKQRWFLSHTLAAVAGAVVTGVLTYIITKGM
jgi:hypothetical protein